MEGEDWGLATRSDELAVEFYDKLVEYYESGRIPADMVNIDMEEGVIEVYYGQA